MTKTQTAIPAVVTDEQLELLFRHGKFTDALEIIGRIESQNLSEFQICLKIDLLLLCNETDTADNIIASFGSIFPKHPHMYLALARYHRIFRNPDGVCIVYSQFKDLVIDFQLPLNQYYFVQVSRFYLLALIDLGNLVAAKNIYKDLVSNQIVKNDPLLQTKLLATGINLFRTLHDLVNYQINVQKSSRLFFKN